MVASSILRWFSDREFSRTFCLQDACLDEMHGTSAVASSRKNNSAPLDVVARTGLQLVEPGLATLPCASYFDATTVLLCIVTLDSRCGRVLKTDLGRHAACSSTPITHVCNNTHASIARDTCDQAEQLRDV